MAPDELLMARPIKTPLPRIIFVLVLLVSVYALAGEPPIETDEKIVWKAADGSVVAEAFYSETGGEENSKIEVILTLPPKRRSAITSEMIAKAGRDIWRFTDDESGWWAESSTSLVGFGFDSMEDAAQYSLAHEDPLMETSFRTSDGFEWTAHGKPSERDRDLVAELQGEFEQWNEATAIALPESTREAIRFFGMITDRGHFDFLTLTRSEFIDRLRVVLNEDAKAAEEVFVEVVAE